MLLRVKKINMIQDDIATRRTVKPDRYTGEIVSDELIWKMLEAANWAPTHGHTEPWRFVVFGGEKKIQLLEFLNGLDDSLHGPNVVRNEKRAQSFAQTSHIISIVCKRGSNPKIPELEELLATAMAVQNMWLVASNLGLGSYWSTGGLAYLPELTSFLGFDAEVDKALGFFYIGMPITGLPQGKRLSPIEDKVRWV
jgi:nitroreductase